MRVLVQTRQWCCTARKEVCWSQTRHTSVDGRRGKYTAPAGYSMAQHSKTLRLSWLQHSTAQHALAAQTHIGWMQTCPRCSLSCGHYAGNDSIAVRHPPTCAVCADLCSSQLTTGKDLWGPNPNQISASSCSQASSVGLCLDPANALLCKCRSLVAAYDLTQDGISNVQVLRDGYTGWINAGR